MVVPIFRIFDIKTAHSFYLDYLGFKIDWHHQFSEGMPYYFQISLDNTVIHLSEHHGDASPGSTVRIEIKDLKSFHASLAKKDYPYANPAIEKTPWHTTELTITDPFSNTLIFYQETE